MNSNVANLGRNTGRVTAAVYTAGLSELGLSLRKKCRVCGHQMSLHESAQSSSDSAPPSEPAPQPITYAQQGPAANDGGADAFMVADELIKLAGLRDAGALSDREFEALKSQLIPKEATAPRKLRRPIDYQGTGPVSFTIDGEDHGILQVSEISNLFAGRPRWDEVTASRDGATMEIFDQTGTKKKWAVVVEADPDDGVSQIEIGPIEMLEELVIAWVTDPSRVGNHPGWEHIEP
jgi:hypothetical protein